MPDNRRSEGLELHESLQREDRVEEPSNRSFGLVFAAFFGMIGVLPLFFGKAPRLWSLLVAAAFAAVALITPRALTPLNRVWLKVGLLLHRIVSPIVLAIMFFLAVTPTGLLMRAFGKDPLRLRFDRNATTYWVPREPPGPAPDSLKDQF